MTSGGAELARAVYTCVLSCVHGPRRVFLRKGALEPFCAEHHRVSSPEKIKKNYLTSPNHSLRKQLYQPFFFFLFCKDFFCFLFLFFFLFFYLQAATEKERKKRPSLFHCSHCVILCLGTAIVCCTVRSTMVFT